MECGKDGRMNFSGTDSDGFLGYRLHVIRVYAS